MSDPTIAQLRSYFAAVVTAIDSEDWAAAMKNYAKAQAAVLALPKSTSNDRAGISYREDLKSLREAIKAAKTESQLGTDRSRLIETRFGLPMKRDTDVRW